MIKRRWRIGHLMASKDSRPSSWVHLPAVGLAERRRLAVTAATGALLVALWREIDLDLSDGFFATTLVAVLSAMTLALICPKPR